MKQLQEWIKEHAVLVLAIDLNYLVKKDIDQVSINIELYRYKFFICFFWIDSPPPGMYNIKSEFDVGKPGSVSHVTKSNVYGFGIGHRAYDKVYLPHKKRENDPDCPGPGKYNLDMYNIGKHARKYSMYSRVKNIAGKYKYSIRLNFSFFLFRTFKY